MSRSNGFNSMFGIEFEDFDSVKKKLGGLTEKINKETSKGIKLGIDPGEITKIINDLSRLSKTNIQILPTGEIIALSKYNAELGKTVSLRQNLTKGTTSLNVNDDMEKAYSKLFDEAIKQQEELAKMYQQTSKQARIDAEKEAKENNRIISEKYKQEQDFINISQSLKQKASQEARVIAESEAKISNKILEDQYKQNEVQKRELLDAEKLVAFEKERLNIRLKNIQVNRKDLVDKDSSNSISSSISGLSGETTQEVKSRVKQLNLEIQRLDQNARMKGLQVGNKNIMSFGESIKATATKLGIFASTAMVLNEVQRTIRNATSYIIELDSSMVNLKKVTDETSDTYSRFLDNMHNAAIQLGTQSNLMVDATTNWAKAGKNLQEAAKLAENTVLLTKIGDIVDVKTAQEYMIAPLQSFNIEAERSIELIDKYNNISNNMATETKDVGEGLNLASNSLSVAGNSLEQSIALIATAEASTKQGGSVIGNALKTISLRLATFKDDETGELIPTMTEDLKNLGIEAVDSAGQIRSTFDILRDLGKIYKDLDTNMQLKLSEQIGGKRQANIVASILTNVDQLERAYGLATDSAGSAMNEFSKYQQGIQYSLDQLKEQVNGLYTSFLSGGFFKGLIDGSADVISTITTVNDTFGTMPSIVTTVVGAMTLFNSKFRESTQVLMGLNPLLSKVFVTLGDSSKTLSYQAGTYMKQISVLKDLSKMSQEAGVSTSGFGKELVGLGTKLVGTTAKLVAVKAASFALQTALSMGLTLVVSTLIGKFSEFVDGLIITGKELRQLNEDAISGMRGNKDLIESVETLIKKEDELEKKISGKGGTYDEQKQYRIELLDVQRKIADILPESSDAFDKEGNAISTNTEKVLENLEAKKKLTEREAIKSIKQNSNYEVVTEAPEKYEETKRQLEEMQEAYRKNEEYMGGKVTTKGIDRLEKKVKQYEESIKIMEASVDALRIAGWEEQRIAEEIFGTSRPEASYKSYEKLMSVVDSYGKKIKEVLGLAEKENDIDEPVQRIAGVEELRKAYISLGYSVEEAAKKIEELNSISDKDLNKTMVSDATTKYGEAITEIQGLYEIVSKLNEAQAMTPALISELSKEYPQLGASINDVSQVQKFLNDEIANQTKIAQEANRIMVENDVNYFNSKIRNTSEWQNYTVAVLNNIKNANLDYYNKNIAGMENELSNAQTLAESRAILESNLITSLAGMWSDYYKTLSDNWYVDGAPVYQYAPGTGTELDKETKKILEKQNEIKKNAKEMANAFSALSTDAFIPFTSSDFVSASDSGSSAKSEKEIADLEIKKDRYYQLNEALKKVNNELDKNDSLENSIGESTYLENKIKLLNQELDINKKIRAEQSKESKELKGKISSWFSFDNDGLIKNQNASMEKLEKWVNSATASEKETRKAQAEELISNAERYMTVMNSEMAKLDKEIIDTSSAINEILTRQTEIKIETVTKSIDKFQAEIDQKLGDINFKQSHFADYSYDDNIRFDSQKLDLASKNLSKLNEEYKKLNLITSATVEGKDLLSQAMSEVEEKIQNEKLNILELTKSLEKLNLQQKESTYNSKMWQKGTQQMNKIDLDMQLVGDDDSVKQLDLMNEKLKLQQSMLRDTELYMNDLRVTNITTAEGYGDMVNKLKSAEESFYSQQTSINSLKESMDSLVKDTLSKYIEQMKEVEEMTAKARQENELMALDSEYFRVSESDFNSYKKNRINSLTDEISLLSEKLRVDSKNSALLDLLKAKQIELSNVESERYRSTEDWLSVQEDMHNFNISQIDAEIESLREKDELEKEATERLQKQNELIELQNKLRNILENKNVRELNKNDDGSWGFSYTHDIEEYESTQNQYQEKQKELSNWEKDLEKEKYIEKLELQKEYEQQSLQSLKELYEKQREELEKAHEEENKAIEDKYEDMFANLDVYLEQLSKKFGGDVPQIIETLQIELDKGKEFIKQFDESLSGLFAKSVLQEGQSNDVAKMFDLKYSEILEGSKRFFGEQFVIRQVANQNELLAINSQNERVKVATEGGITTLSEMYKVGWDTIITTMQETFERGIVNITNFNQSLVIKTQEALSEISSLESALDSITSLNSQIASASAMSMSVPSVSDMPNVNSKSTVTNNVTNNVSFPHATNSGEIEKAISNLSTRATQKK